MSKTLRKRIGITVSLLLVTPLMVFSSMPFKEWSVALGVAMVCAMCLVGLWVVWTRPMPDEPDDEPEPEDRLPGGRRSKKRIRLF
jgi:hypothetical protein